MGTMVQVVATADYIPATVDLLPAEILVEVFSYLPLADMARAAAVCERWRDLLTRHTAVWRHKEYFTRKKSSRDEVVAIAGSMPRLRCLHVLRDNEFGVHIAWPEAAVSLCCDTRSSRRSAAPYAVEFDVRRLVVCGAAFELCLRWVRCETLEAVRVADQCEGAGTHPASPFYYYRDRRRAAHCYGPTCSFRGLRPAFCALCAYSHHFNCVGTSCPLGGPTEVEDGFDLWCHPDRERSAGPRARHFVAEAEGSLEAELEEALRRPLPARCPSLEEVTVSGTGLAPADLRLLCAAGRLRVLRVESACLRGLSFLRHCRTTLEELTVADATWLPPESFRELGHLCGLRLLRLSRFRATGAAILEYTRHLAELHCILQKPLQANAATPLPAQDEDIFLD